ncbi:MAG: FHA domain-containing RING-H2 finger protein [Verrucomicrobiota bacterium]
MGRLVIQTEAVAPGAFDLRPGLNVIGRGPRANFRIDHESVSAEHCEILLANQFARVRDLDSTNGTFIDGARVSEDYLTPGQILRLGSVELKFHATIPYDPETKEPALELVEKPVEPPPTIPPPLRPCFRHPRTEATLICTHCRLLFCEACVYRHFTGLKRNAFCPVCTGLCLPIPEFERREKARAEKKAVSRDFFANLKEAYRYPFKGDGPILLVGGAFFFAAITLIIKWALTMVPWIIALVAGVILGLFLFIFMVGYISAYMWQMVLTSAQGDEFLPDWPDFSDFWHDIARPCLQYLGLLAVCYGPAFLYDAFTDATLLGAMDYTEDRIHLAVWLLLLFLGNFYFPMATLAVVMHDNILGLNPWTVVLSILRIPRHYFVAFLAMVAVALSADLATMTAYLLMNTAFAPLPGVWALVYNFLTLYFLAVEMRILGLIYYCNDEKLGWFRPIMR